MSGPSVTPSMPWPVANSTRSARGCGPMAGRPSGVQGRRPDQVEPRLAADAEHGRGLPDGSDAALVAALLRRAEDQAAGHAQPRSHRVGHAALVVQIQRDPQRRRRRLVVDRVALTGQQRQPDAERARKPARPGARGHDDESGAQHAVAGVDGARADRPHLDAGAQAHAALDRRGADGIHEPPRVAVRFVREQHAGTCRVRERRLERLRVRGGQRLCGERPAGRRGRLRGGALLGLLARVHGQQARPPEAPVDAELLEPREPLDAELALQRLAARGTTGRRSADVAREPGSERRAHAEPERRVAPQHPAQPGAEVLGRGDRPRVARHEQARVPPRAALAPAAAALEHGDRGTVAGELVGAARAHDPGADHDDVGRAGAIHAAPAAIRARSRRGTGRRPRAGTRRDPSPRRGR